MIKIAPSILASDFSALGKEVKRISMAKADMVHIDVMDGCFVPNITMGPVVVKALRRYTNLPFDVHLMINKPEKHIKAFAKAGADIITVHIEACGNNLLKVIKTIKNLGIKAGVSLKPKTKSKKLFRVLNKINMVLVMTVNPGFGGQTFMPEVLPKIRNLKIELDKRNLKVDIGVDGGIDFRTAPLAINAGANVLISGVALFNSKNMKQAVKKLRSTK